MRRRRNEETTKSQEEGTEHTKSMMNVTRVQDGKLRDTAGQVGPSVTAPLHPLTSLCNKGRWDGGTSAVNGAGQESSDRTWVAVMLQWRDGAGLRAV